MRAMKKMIRFLSRLPIDSMEPLPRPLWDKSKLPISTNFDYVFSTFVHIPTHCILIVIIMYNKPKDHLCTYISLATKRKVVCNLHNNSQIQAHHSKKPSFLYFEDINNYDRRRLLIWVPEINRRRQMLHILLDKTFGNWLWLASHISTFTFSCYPIFFTLRVLLSHCFSGTSSTDCFVLKQLGVKSRIEFRFKLVCCN